MHIIIRDACKQDCEAICRLNRDALGYDFALEATRSRLEAILATAGNRLFVAEADSLVVGYVHAAEYECTYTNSLKNILALAVDENHRGQGIGHRLLHKVESWAEETGSSGVRLVSGFDREGAHRFYLACGYTDRKNQKNFIKILSDRRGSGE